MDLICLDIIPRLLTEADNIPLNHLLLIHEVLKMVFSIEADSVASPNRFSSLFFQHFWYIIQENVYNAVIDFLEGGHLPRGFTAKEGECLSIDRFQTYYLLYGVQ